MRVLNKIFINAQHPQYQNPKDAPEIDACALSI